MFECRQWEGIETARIAVNGLGRIGRAAFKILLETPELELIAVNDVAALDNLVYLLRYDTVYGRYGKPISVEAGHLVVDEKKIIVLNQRDPAQLPWAQLRIDIVLECTGHFTRAEDLKKHLDAGARSVILSAPPKGEGIGSVVHGVNRTPQGERLISCARRLDCGLDPDPGGRWRPGQGAELV